MSIFLGAVKKHYKVGDTFKGNRNFKYQDFWQLLKENKTYIISGKNLKIIKIFEKPIDALTYRDKYKKYVNDKIHFTNKLI
jgi:hypothetical protein